MIKAVATWLQYTLMNFAQEASSVGHALTRNLAYNGLKMIEMVKRKAKRDRSGIPPFFDLEVRGMWPRKLILNYFEKNLGGRTGHSTDKKRR